jgi:putative ABC transport system permease protein
MIPLLLNTTSVAVTALFAHRGRAFLAMLGIAIGTGAVIAMVGLGNGAELEVRERITNLMSRGQLAIRFGEGVLTHEDVKTIEKETAAITHIVPVAWGQHPVRYRGRTLGISFAMTTPDFLYLYGVDMEVGRFVERIDVDHARPVVVFGANVAKRIGGGPHFVGKTVLIRGLHHEVIGVLALTGKPLNLGYRIDDMAYLPLGSPLGDEPVRWLNMKLESDDVVLESATQIERILRRTRRIPLGLPNDFKITPNVVRAAASQATTDTFRNLLLSIAAISLLVGGIGVANVMLVSVTERANEIGVRRAVGARRSIIMSQFALEAVMLCAFGGGIGILSGIGTASIMSEQFGWSTIIMPSSIFIAFGFSVVAGLGAGIYPAYRASRVDPVEALRHE